MSLKIRSWQWPNILGLDAAAIAIAWLAAYSDSVGIQLSWSAYLVLFLSVCLTYTADRLFDIRKLSVEKLITVRHQWTHAHAKKMWPIWWAFLSINLATGTQLQEDQLIAGSVLLVVTLAYTALNQRFSKRFFPKECFVALIFSGGIAVFVPQDANLPFLTAFAVLCLINCIMIGLKESEIDAQMERRQCAIYITSTQVLLLATLATATCLVIEFPLHRSIATGLIGLILIQLISKRLSPEIHRVLADATLLLCLAVGFV